MAKEGRVLQREWKRVRIADSLRLVNGAAFKPTNWTKDGLPIVRIQNLNNPEAAFNRTTRVLPGKFKLRGGELLFAWSGTPGTSFGAHIWRGGEAWLNQHIFNVLFDENEWDKKFLQFAINQNLADYIRAAHGGAGLAHITKGRFEESELLQPTPNQQRRIVAEIEKQFTRLEAGVAALRRVQANLKRYRAAVLKAACEGRLVPTEAELARVGRVPPRGVRPNAKNAASGDAAYNAAPYETGEQLLQRILTERRQNWQGRGQYKEPAALDTTNLPPLPNGWTWASVEQLSTRVQYGSSAKTNEHSTGVPVLRMGNIQDGKFDFGRLKYLPKAHDEFPELLLARGDLLFNRTNSAELVGKTAVFKGTPYPCSFASYLIRVRFGRGCVPDFVNYFINSVLGRAWIADVVSQQVGQANVNGTKLQALAVPLPPLAEQTRIVAEVERRLSVVEESETVVSANLQRATHLRQSILQKAFSGSLITLRTRNDALKRGERGSTYVEMDIEL